MEDNSVSHREHLGSLSVTFAGPSGPAFSFLCLSFCPPALSFPPAGRGWFFSLLLLDSSTTGSHGSNRAGNPFCCCCFLTRLLKPHTGSHGARFVFVPKTRFTPPPKGGGAGFCVTWGSSVFLGSCLWQLRPTNGSHGFNGAGNPFHWCRFPTWSSKPHTGPQRAEFGVHRLFLPPFLGGNPASWRSSL